MRHLRLVVRMVLIFTMVLGAGAVFGQDYPNKPIRIVTGTAGGGLDFAARLMASGLVSSMGQQVIIENRGFVMAPPTVAKARPDGYTLLFFGSPFWLAPLMRTDLSYDPVKDFSPITLAVTSPDILVVHPSLPVKSVKELIALAKARPGELNYASSAIGAGSHLAGELFKAMAGVNILHIPYKGVTVALNDLIGGQVQVMFATAGASSPHIKSGRIRALAVGSPKPSALFPGLPPVADSGLPGYQSVGIYGIFAPAGTPAAVIDRLHQEFVRALNRADVKEKLLNSGVEAVGSTPPQLAAAVKSDMTRLGKLIKDLDIRSN
ncbi:MAG: tripartite tricarboxylate transporter substrate binding protein [Betaproteobacteria bacterium]|nr:tripartite tricarboxylate transporter substrate binding protein [Betaproteobacteria bacterium]